MESGCIAAQWSPDGEAIAIITGQGTLLLMNSSWQVIWEQQIPYNSSGKEVVVSDAAISWRGDGKYFASTIKINDSNSGAQLHIWDRQGGELHATGEHADNLHLVIAWQPNCRHLYSAQRLVDSTTEEKEEEEKDHHQEEETTTLTTTTTKTTLEDKVKHVGAWKRELKRQQEAQQATDHLHASHKVTLFERNGLQHGGFGVPTRSAEYYDHFPVDLSTITSLTWSRDSEFLAVVLSLDDKCSKEQVIQLWHRRNWHWHLKYEKRVRGCGALSVCWDASQPLCLYYYASTTAADRICDDLGRLQFHLMPMVSSWGTAGVVDGRRLALTSLRHTTIPPPMCEAAVDFSSPVVCFAISSFTSGHPEAVFAVLSTTGRSTAKSSSYQCAVVRCKNQDSWGKMLEEEGVDQPGKYEQRVLKASSLFEVALGEGDVVMHPRLAAWLTSTSILLVCASSSVGGGEKNNCDQLVVLTLKEDDDIAAGTPQTMMVEEDHIVSCISGSAPGEALLQTHGGKLYKFVSPLTSSSSIEFELLSPSCHFSKTCHQITAIPIAARFEQLTSWVPPAIGLAVQTGELYWGATLLMKDVTSFCVRTDGAGGPFLLYTTRTDQLYTYSLESLLSLSSSSSSFGAVTPCIPTNANKNIHVRAVEQGALLVAAPPHDIQAVLQMPRGNLETVRPRALVLPAITAALDQDDYIKALELTGVNRVDPNVVVDHKWPEFVVKAEVVVGQVKRDEDLAELLLALKDENVLTELGIYAPTTTNNNAPGGGSNNNNNTSWRIKKKNNGTTGKDDDNEENSDELSGMPSEKVVSVCIAVRQALESMGLIDQRLKTAVTTYSRCNELGQALLLVKKAKDQAMMEGASSSNENTNGTYGHNSPDNNKQTTTAEAALKHLLLYSSEEALYQAALSEYELELAYMVIAHSQRDPGEYLFELQQFAAIEDGAGRKYAIDLHLRRFDLALSWLMQLAVDNNHDSSSEGGGGEEYFEKALSLAKEQGLLRRLIALCTTNNNSSDRRPSTLSATTTAPRQEEMKKKVYETYGQVLQSKNKNEDAALAYISSGNLHKASECYQSAGNWKMALAMASKLDPSPAHITSVAMSLVIHLSESHRHGEAGRVAIEYLDDVDEGMVLLTEGKEWQECMRVAYSHGRGDLIETVVAPRAAVSAEMVLSEAKEDIERIGKYWSRLKELREKRVMMEIAVEAAGGGVGDEMDVDIDGQSDVISLASGLSVYTDSSTRAGTTATGSSNVSASTIGGRQANKQQKKKRGPKQKRGSKIRAGGPEEEAQLAQHIISLAPTTALLTEVGQLTELLCVLGHDDDARVLQQTLGRLSAVHAEAAQDILNNQPPTLRNNEEKWLNECVVKIKEIEKGVKTVNWKWDMLRS